MGCSLEDDFTSKKGARSRGRRFSLGSKMAGPKMGILGHFPAKFQGCSIQEKGRRNDKVRHGYESSLIAARCSPFSQLFYLRGLW